MSGGMRGDEADINDSTVFAGWRGTRLIVKPKIGLQ